MPLADLALAEQEPAVLPEATERSRAPRRAPGLDALRGLAILGMVLSGLLPFGEGALPAWMYHAQTPPPTHAYDLTLVGMTWVDVVFPLFLFALGAAVPLALGPRRDEGVSRRKLSLGAFGRGLLLLAFALYRPHTNPGALLGTYGNRAWWIGLLAFVLLFPVFVRLPKSWYGWVKTAIRLAGWVAIFALLYILQYPDGGRFSLERHDIILVILANVAVTTALVWLWLGRGITGRLCLMGLLVALHLARRYSHWGMPYTDLQFARAWVGDHWFDQIFWAFAPGYQKYLLITIPGTLAGDALAEWLRPTARRLSFSIQNSRWRELSMLRCFCLALVSTAVVASIITGFSLVEWKTTAAVAVALGVLGLSLVYSPPARRRLRRSSALGGQPRVSALVFRQLYTWGLLWLVLGLALYPYQGGIRKDPATLSYLFVCAGLAHMILVVFTVLTDAMHRSGSLFLLIDNGKNPMIAYVAAGMVVLPVLHLLPMLGVENAAGVTVSVYDWLISITNTDPWLAFARGVGLTLVVAMFVSAVTRMKIFWRT